MKTRWIVTPQFFEIHEPALSSVVPDDACVNGPHNIPDRSAESLALVHEPIARFVKDTVSSGAVPVSVAGDCCASLPVMAGVTSAGKKPDLVWIDAHGDFNIPETSPSQFLGGMPLAMMVGRGAQTLCRNVDLAPVKENQVWLVDARDLDPPEQISLAASEVNHIDMGRFSQLCLNNSVYLHLDIDVIDAAEAPGSNYPVPGGPGIAETVSACRRFALNNEIIAISISGWTGHLDKDGRTRDACAKVLDALISGEPD